MCLPDGSETRKFKRRFAFEAFHGADVACHGILYRVQKSMDFVGFSLSNDFDSSVRKILYRPHDCEFFRYFFRMKTKPNSLDAAAYKARYSSLGGGIHVKGRSGETKAGMLERLFEIITTSSKIRRSTTSSHKSSRRRSLY